jgi:hypothetical protein
MKKEAPENEASHFSHGLREAVSLFAVMPYKSSSVPQPRAQNFGV